MDLKNKALGPKRSPNGTTQNEDYFETPQNEDLSTKNGRSDLKRRFWDLKMRFGAVKRRVRILKMGLLDAKMRLWFPKMRL